MFFTCTLGKIQHGGGKTDDECVCRDAKFPAVLGCPDPERSDHLNAISDIYFIFLNGEMLIKIRKKW